MDTNDFATLLHALSANKVVANSNNIVLVITMVLSAVSPVILAFSAYLMAKSKAVAEKTAEHVDKIHAAVNSERTAMIAKLDERERTIIALLAEKAITATEKAVAVEQKHGETLAAAVAAKA